MISQKEFILKNAKTIAWKQKYPARVLRILARFKPIKLKSRVERSDFTLLTICNRSSFFMVKCSLVSFLKKSNDWPKRIVIVSDGSWQPSLGIKYFSTLQKMVNLTCVDWQFCANYHLEKGRTHLSQYAMKQIWGKKLAAILLYAEQGLTLYSDSDVLWFNSPMKETYFSRSVMMRISLDNSHNYDESMIRDLKLDYLYDRDPINCGIILVKGDMYAASQMLEKTIQYEAENIGKFSEQTILAVLESEIGETWGDSAVVSRIDDLVSPTFCLSNYSDETIARHYLWALKWLFWRDYIFLI